MIIALLALAIAMILGGVLAAFLGWDIVLVERGWTMVIAGSISAGSGALLLGVTAVLSRLERIRAELSRLQTAGLQAGRTMVVPEPRDPSLPALSGGSIDESEPAKAAPAEALDEAPAATATAEAADHEPPLEEAQEEAPRPAAPVLPFRSRNHAEPKPLATEEAPDVKVPEFLLADRLRSTEAESRISDVDASLYETETPPVASPPEQDLGEERRAEPSPTSAPEPSPTTPESEPEAEKQGAPTVIGTYNSGDNKYVMFSDGSIEADTPRGVFHFNSLDELKEFIAAGGEGGSSVAH